ncbi:biopolymer transporter ExbB [Salipiger sp. IMCC34102]|uniref:biopolymer transporter ExbB n=1 Tax=Salipiger sp. IMCC34102 TaxID=2510647 RepID=UPI00101CA6C8|nr:biopolymer transporter ExbB [Salipiger sp. IMCC34102]RYH04591.1 biopolymer transporter ExbB [Salipiger sp. IMCC34102]
MLVVLALVAAGLYLGFTPLRSIFLSNPWLNGAILVVFLIGVYSTFAQVYQLMKSVEWIEGFAAGRSGHHLTAAPSLLAPLATLLRSVGKRMQINSTSARSIQDSVAERIDEDREITRYIGNTLIFLGLLGTFYGLATTVPALVDTIRSLSPGEGESGDQIFTRLQQGLESQLGGMGTAFSSSLLGLAGSLIVGLLELFAGHGQNRFYRELEEWLSTITRLGFATGDDGGREDSAMLTAFAEHMGHQLDAMAEMFSRSDAAGRETDEHLAQLARTIDRLVDSQRGQSSDEAALTRIAEGQERLIEKLEEGGIDGLDAESRMRLRSLDTQMLRVTEEIASGRQELIGELRSEMANLIRALRARQGG